MNGAAGEAVAMRLAYDGSEFQGWQLQPSAPTIQGEVERALGRLFGTARRVAVVGAGRTDSGVHALGQVAGCRVPLDRPPAVLQRGLNALLPSAIRVLDVTPVPREFHPCRSVVRKTYRYRIVNRELQFPFETRWSWHIRQPLDLEEMRRAARLLTGRHDFRSFVTAGGQSRTTVRTLERLALRRLAGGVVEIEAVGEGFLYRMVRNIGGLLVEIGLGRRSAQGVREILAARDRARAGRTAPAAGLCLVSVEYPDRFGIGT